eukprot:4155819-Heterocapsa_arctica.AAC.1
MPIDSSLLPIPGFRKDGCLIEIRGPSSSPGVSDSDKFMGSDAGKQPSIQAASQPAGKPEQYM